MLRLRPFALAAFTAVTLLAFWAAPAAADTATFQHPAGPAASAMDHVYRAVLGVTVTIFVLVGGWLLYSALRFRVRRGETYIEPPAGARLDPARARLDDRAGARAGRALGLHPGSRRHRRGRSRELDARERLGAAVLVLVRLRRELRRCRKAPSNPSTLVVPENTPVKLEVRSKDVNHDWWVPALGHKIDAIPGQTNTTWFKATRTGTFRGPVRRVLRPRPRHDGDHREGGLAVRLERLHRQAEEGLTTW